jgi:hypothetical protein
MEVKEFQDSRKAELDSFKKQYQFLKKQYSDALMSAIKEKDPNQQQSLIQQVQQANANLTSELHTIIGMLNKGSNGFDAKELDDLTNDLINYQKEYAEIEKSNDKVKTLKAILNTTKSNLKNATYMYYIYIAVLIFLAFYVGYLVLRTSWSRTLFKGSSGQLLRPLGRP